MKYWTWVPGLVQALAFYQASLWIDVCNVTLAIIIIMEINKLNQTFLFEVLFSLVVGSQILEKSAKIVYASDW